MQRSHRYLLVVADAAEGLAAERLDVLPCYPQAHQELLEELHALLAVVGRRALHVE